MAREAWTDERLDDLKGQVEIGFAEVKADIREVRGEIRELRTEMNTRFESMQRTMVIGFVTLSASIIGGMLGAVTLA